MDVPLDKITNIMIQGAVNRAALSLSPKSIRNAHGLLTAALSMYLPDFCVRTTLPANLPVTLALWLGLRMSEVRGIRYGDITDGVLTIQNVRIAMGDGGNIVKSQTKTYNSTRQLVLPEHIIKMIGSGNRQTHDIP